MDDNGTIGILRRLVVWGATMLMALLVTLLATACASEATLPSATSEATGTTTTAAPPAEAEDEALVISAEGVDELRIGQTAQEALDTGLVADLRDGCHILNEVQYGDLTGGLEGLAVFEAGRLTALQVRRGALTTEGLRPGEDLDRLSRLYPSPDHEVVDVPGAEETFGERMITVARDGEVLFEVTAPAGRDVISGIWVPGIFPCD